ncbi:MAG: DUF308 domain-containing protein [Victivallaceae bacterium]|nr:DUF308 domain-containing protein [Victivallaceae bacterium]
MKDFAGMGRDAFFSVSPSNFFIRGLLAAILGVCFIMRPGATLDIMVYIVGVMLAVLAVMLFFSGRPAVLPPLVRGSMSFMAALALLAGIFMMFFPLLAVSIVLMVIAFFILTGGIQQIFAARGVKQGKGYMVASGIFAVLLGVAMIFSPRGAIEGVGLFLGIFLLMYGVFAVTLSFKLKR